MSNHEEFGPDHKGVFPVQSDVTIIGSGVAARLLPDGSLQISVGKSATSDDYVGNRVATVGSAQVGTLRELLSGPPAEVPT